MALDLSKQIGPLPAGAWIIVVGAGLGISYFAFRGKGGSGTQTPPLVDPGTGVGGGGFETVTPPPASGVAPAPKTNEEWAKMCIDWLIAQGYDSTVSDSALRKYLVNEKLSTQEWALVRIALGHFGSPPVPLPPNPNVPPWTWPLEPAPSPSEPGTPGEVFPFSSYAGALPPPPVSVQGSLQTSAVMPSPAPAPSAITGSWVTTEQSTSQLGTLHGISERFYGSPGKAIQIFQANAVGVKRPDGSKGSLVNPNSVAPGIRLFIPQ